MTAPNSAIARLSDAWSARTPRERLMLAVMAVAVAAFVLWFAVISPLLTWRRDAIEDYGDAAQAHATVQASVQPAVTSGAVGSAQTRVARLAQDHGLQAAITEADGQVEVRIEAAPAEAVFAWIAALETDRIAVRSLSVLENADATVQAEVAMVPNARP